MLVSINEVKKYVNLDNLSPELIADSLTYAGVEVEEIKRLASGTNLVIGEILTCENHPDSDHLHVLRVNLGNNYGVKQIVCGAPNARAGLKVIVSRVGAVLPGGEIKLGVIRGVESNGMCCSLSELGVDSKYLSEYQLAGIEELPSDAPVGEENVLGYLGLDDVILNLKVLANRPDLLSVYNVAKELGAIFDREVNIPNHIVEPTFKTSLVVGSATEKCKQFASREVKSIVTKPSPKWMQEALRSLGCRSINNIVDIGNYVMYLTGQPLHMYDADKLANASLEARDDYEGSFVALDEKTYDVIKGDLVICCNRKPMCLGGVMGSLECAVDENTKNIYIEAASFDAATIRRTSNRLGLSSESSSRFVKGTNHFQSEFVLNLACYLLKEYAEAKEFTNSVNYLNEAQHDLVINSSVERINSRLGTNFNIETISRVLKVLNFELDVKGNNFSCKVPAYRLDVTCDADLSEEVIRLCGYKNVNSVLPTLETTVGVLNESQKRMRELREYLVSIGLDECLTYTLLSKKEQNLFCLLNNEEHYSILNPLTDEHEVVRTHVLHSLLKCATYNISRQNKNLALFEASNVISKTSRSKHLAIVLVGNDLRRGLMDQLPYDFYHMKGIVENIFALFGIEKSRYKFDKSNLKGNELHPGKSADIFFQGQVIGRFGELHPNQYKAYDLGKTNCIVLEMDLGSLITAKVGITKASEISKFPTVNRDLALLVKEDISSGDLLRTIKMVGKGIVNDCEVFDLYVGDNIEKGKKSIAITVSFSSLDHTLTDKEINDVFDKIKFELSKTYNAELRS